LPREEAAAERERRERERVVRHAVVAARVVRLAGVALPVGRDADPLLDEGANALVGGEELGADEHLELVDAVDAEAEALDARHGVLARGLRGPKYVGRVVDEVERVETKADGRVRLEAAQVDGAEAAELGAGAAAVEADRACAVDEPQLGK